MAVRIRLKELRSAAGMSQNDLARSIGMSPQYVQKIEQGKIKSLGLDTADKLKKVLGCKAGDLLEDIADTDLLQVMEP